MALTARRIVLTALTQKIEQYCSVNELRTQIFEKQNTNMDVRTIVTAIDELRDLGHQIAEQTERRGKLNLPVKVFRLTQHAILITQNL